MSGEMEKESALEKLSGSVITTSATVLLAAFTGTPLAALLPVLTNTLASNRHKQRVERAIEDIYKIIKAHEGQLTQLTDSQYKLINEAILITLQNTEDEKLKYLKAAIDNTFSKGEIKDLEAAQLSRIIRDISSEEIIFLINHSTFSSIIFNQKPNDDSELSIDQESKHGEIASGLISLGLIVPGAASWGGMGRHHFSALVPKLIDLVRDK